MRNASVLHSLLTLQKVPYDFGFYQIDFKVDHPCISLSHGNPVTDTSASIPLMPLASRIADTTATSVSTSDQPPPDGTGGLKSDALARLRVYVGATRHMSMSLDGKSSGMAEEDFVKARQQGQGVTAEDFHRWITLAQLTALSLGDTTMTEDHWAHMKTMEGQVKARSNRIRSNTPPGG
ncbi:unnamed protein product, partial [Choristocarpus tenellus]